MTPASAVAEAFSLVDVPAWQPRFNIAPSQPVPVVRLSPAAAETPETGNGHAGSEETHNPDVAKPAEP